MPEKEFKVYPVGIYYVCDNCGEGQMIYKELDSQALIFDSENGFLVHVCSKCGCEKKLVKKYPTIEHRKVDE